MTKAQRAHYFRDLWPAACARHGWPVHDDDLRRDVTLEATDRASTSDLDQDGITTLFRFLERLANPDSVAATILVQNPDDAREADHRRRFTYAIERVARRAEFNDAYIDTAAVGFLRAENAATWRDLSSVSLKKLRSTLKKRRSQKAGGYAPRKGCTPYHRRPEVKTARAEARRPRVEPRPEVLAALPF